MKRNKIIIIKRLIHAFEPILKQYRAEMRAHIVQRISENRSLL